VEIVETVEIVEIVETVETVEIVEIVEIVVLDVEVATVVVATHQILGALACKQCLNDCGYCQTSTTYKKVRKSEEKSEQEPSVFKMSRESKLVF